MTPLTWGVLNAAMLVGQVNRADQGTVRMQEIARAVREGANAYLAAQFRRIGPLILIITVILYFTYTGSHRAFAVGRAAAFFMGSIFSWLVGFVGMRLATKGNLRVAAAATRSYGEAMQLGYRTGTITGMLTEPSVALTVPRALTARENTGNCISVRSFTSRTPPSMISPLAPRAR